MSRQGDQDLRFLNTVLSLVEGAPGATERCLRSIETEPFRQWCQRQQIGGLVYLLLEELSVRAVVQRELPLRLRETYLEQWARGERLRLQLAEFADRMAKLGEDFIVLKGLPFAQRYYGAPDRRSTGDLDILVPTARAHSVAQRLEDCGLVRRSPRWDEDSPTLQHVHEVELALDGATVELHHALRVHPAFRIDHGAIWRDRIVVEIPGGSYPALSDEHALLMHLLSLHTDIQIGQTNARWLIDMYRVLEFLGEDFPWPDFLEARSAEGTAKICINGLALFLVVTRSDERFPGLGECLNRHRGEIVLEPDRAVYLDLLRGASLLERKSWPLRQYEGGTARAFSWWLSGMPRRIAAKPAAFAKDLTAGPESPWEDSDEGGTAGLLERGFGVDPATLQSTVLHFGSLRANLLYQQAAHREAVEELFRLRPEPATGGDSGSPLDVVITIFGQEAEQVALQRLPSRPLIVRPLESLVEIHEGVAHSWLYLERTPVEIFIALDLERSSRQLLLHSLMVVLNKLFSLQGRYHLHAAAIGFAGETALFFGGKGAGKSTISVALGRAGGTVYSEDHIMLREDGGGFQVSGCDGNLRLTEKSEAHFFDQPLEGRIVEGQGMVKKEVEMRTILKSSPFVESRVERLFFPFVGEHFEVSPLSAEEAIGLLLEPVLERHRFTDEDETVFLDVFKRLVETTETWRLSLSRDLDELSKLANFLRDLALDRA